MEKGGARLDQVGSIFGVMTDNMSSPAYQALDKEWSPKLSAAFDRITLDPKLFAGSRRCITNATASASTPSNCAFDPP